MKSYLVRQAAGQRELIAMYAGALGDNAVERYAMFLTSLELSADITERRLALTRAKEHGLDMERVAVVTAERTIEKAFSVRVSFPHVCFETHGMRSDPAISKGPITFSHWDTTTCHRS